MKPSIFNSSKQEVALFTMKSTTILCFVLLSILFIENINAENLSKDRNIAKRIDASKKQQFGMWFGPRLGRRKRMPSNDDLYRTTVLKREQLEDLIETLMDSSLIILSVNEGKAQNLNDVMQKQNDLDLDYQLPGDNYLRF